MSEDEGIETSADLVDVKTHLGDVGVGVHKFIDLQLVLEHVGLDWFALTQELWPVANAVFSSSETCIFLLVGKNHQNDRIFLDHVHTVPKIRGKGQRISVFGANIAVLRFYLSRMSQVLITRAFLLSCCTFSKLNSHSSVDLNECEDHLQIRYLCLLTFLLILCHFEVRNRGIFDLHKLVDMLMQFEDLLLDPSLKLQHESSDSIPGDGFDIQTIRQMLIDFLTAE